MNDPYWTLDTSLFEGRFRYFGSEPALVRGKVHTENEDYRPSDINQEITPIAITRGTRTYVHCKPFVLIPDIVVTIGLYKQPSETGAIGEVIASEPAPKMKEVEIGNAQAWYYPDGTIVLWECYLERFFADQPIDQDPNMKALWESFTRFLVQQFPAARQVVTTAHDPMFETLEYQAFLHSLGFEHVAQAAFGKQLG